jgi:uncharacterized BrkB/YihY/UPF0761 family membrane protein
MVVDIPVTIELGRVRVAATTMIRSLMMMMMRTVHRRWRRRRRRTTIKRLFLATMMMTVHFTTAMAMVETIDTTTRHLADKLVNMVAKLYEYQ